MVIKNLNKKYEVTLRFRLDLDAQKDYINKWKKIKRDTEKTKNKVLFNYFLSDNINYKYLERAEGGLELGKKQFRFREWYNPFPTPLDNDIYSQPFEDRDNWTFEEINHILKSFVFIFNSIYKMDGGVKGSIELIPLDMLQ